MRLVLVHGFTQSSASWEAVRRHLPAAVDDVELEVLSPDVPDGLDFAATARTLTKAGGPGIYCGYSMGGRLCLRGALDAPRSVHALVLVSATAGIADDDARAERAVLDDRLAAEAGTLGAEEFVRRWLQQPLFSLMDRGAGEVDRRVAGTSVERLEHQLRVLGQGRHQPMWDRLGELRMPVAVVSGYADRKYEAIGDDMVAAMPSSLRVHIEGGHALPLEQPEAVADVLIEMVRRVSDHEGFS